MRALPNERCRLNAIIARHALVLDSRFSKHISYHSALSAPILEGNCTKNSGTGILKVSMLKVIPHTSTDLPKQAVADIP